MPKIGKRMIKSSIAVFLCFVVYLFRQQEGIVFYSCIAAVLCIQQDITNTKRVGANRVVGTFIGGLVGMLVLAFEKAWIPQDYVILEYMLTSFMIIPIIYITVLLKKTSASYISCVVFMSVTVSHGGDVNPYLFAMNRVIDTLIGIVIAYGVNSFHLPYGNHKDTLFVTSLDHTLLNQDGELSNYTKVKLRQLLEQGANITVATSRTPSTFLPLLQGIPFPYPLIIMNGAALYDIKNQTYTNCKVIRREVLQEVLEVFERLHINCFTYAIIHQMLHVYYGEFQNPIEEDIYHALRKMPYRNYVCGTLPDEHNSVYLHAIHEEESIQKLYDELRTLPSFYELHVVMRKNDEHKGYSDLHIYSKEAGKKEAVSALMETYKFEKLCVFGDDLEDLPLMGMADESYVVRNGCHELRAHAHIIGSNNDDSVVHKIETLYHSRKK